jgi:hypothetical protein
MHSIRELTKKIIKPCQFYVMYFESFVSEVDVRQSVLMLLLVECVLSILACQKVRLGFLNMRSVRTLAAFNITESISTLCSLTGNSNKNNQSQYT